MIMPKNIRRYLFPLLLLVVFVFVSFLFVIRTTSLNKQLQNRTKEVTDLNEKLTILEEVITNSSGEAELDLEDERSEEENEVSDNDMSFPFINYVPEGIFTEDEKDRLTDRLVEPFFDFYNEEEMLYIALIIEKLTSAEDEGEFRFDIQTLDRYGNYGGFLYGEGEKLEWWLPDCLDKCAFSEKFEQKYPEIIEKYKQ